MVWIPILQLACRTLRRCFHCFNVVRQLQGQLPWGRVGLETGAHRRFANLPKNW